MGAATLFLAQIMGPILVALGVGIFFSRKYYMKVYRDLEHETLAVMVGGIATLAAGIAVVLNHNVWGTLPEMIVSLFGWLMVVKGVALTAFPKSVDAFAESVMRSSFFTGWAVVAIVLGGYLSWVAYFT